MMDDPRRLAVLALIGVLSVALVAATITTTEQSTVVRVEGSLNVTDAPEEIWSAPPGLYSQSGPDSDSGLCLGGTNLGVVTAGIAVLLAGTVVAVYYRYDGLAAVGVVGMGVPIVMLASAIADACGRNGLPGTVAETSDALGLGGAATTLTQVIAAAPTWLLVLLGALIAASAVVAFGDRTDVRALLLRMDNPQLGELDDEEEDAAAAVGRVAGRAADRIETGAAADNEVFRAWRSMTEHLDVDQPESSTPAEFADAAVDAGLSRGGVTELTELFEAVRYGGQAPTAERERRAVEALRRVEREAGEASRAGTEPESGDGGDRGGDRR